ncbi:MAG: methylmalonyl Co-A mutase-associated GTPase MeaB [Candidatus Thermoplasmatota archaeon]|nr:methylmalonyl Co-A mutase-associated GTPase MeaB [Candidatus Thermoplasmatota archaeon]
MSDIVQNILKGDQRSIARLITLAENNDKIATTAMKDIHPYTGNAQVIGITGVMGSGKSTLICELTRLYRKLGKTVGIIAIDPTSPFSGGALLGDRVRMMELAMDDGVFIRSLGTRGMLGGLTSAVYDVVEILDACGKDVVIVETVGVGQAEVDIIKIADTTLVVIVPGLGDSIQTLKAGVMEIADIYVINKADRPGVEQTIAEVESLVDITCSGKDRKTPVLSTIAKQGKGIDVLLQEIEDHRSYLEKTHLFEKQRRLRYEAELVEIIRKRLMSFIFDEQTCKQRINDLLDRIGEKKTDPYTAAEEILGTILK